MKTVITSIGQQKLATATTTSSTLDISSVRFGTDVISGSSASTLEAYTNVSGYNFQVGSSAISYSILNKDTIVFTITLDETVGNYQFGNYGLFDSSGNLILLVALDKAVSKTNTTSPSGANKLVLYPILKYANASAVVNLTILTTTYAALPSVTTVSQLPDAATSSYNAYVVTNDSTIGGAANLYLNTGEGWSGLCTFDMANFSVQNIVAAATSNGVGFGQTKTLPLSASADANANTVSVVGSLNFAEGYTYTIEGSGIPTGTVANGINSSNQTISVLTLTQQTTAQILMGSSVHVSGYSQVSTTGDFPVWQAAASGQNFVVVKGTLLYDSSISYTITGTGVPASAPSNIVNSGSTVSTVQISNPTSAAIAAFSPISLTSKATSNFVLAQDATSGAAQLKSSVQLNYDSSTTYTASGTGITDGTTVTDYTWDSTNSVGTITLSSPTTADLAMGATVVLTYSAVETLYTADDVAENASALDLIGQLDSTATYTLSGSGITSGTTTSTFTTSTTSVSTLYFGSNTQQAIPPGTVFSIAQKYQSITVDQDCLISDTSESGSNTISVVGNITFNADYSWSITGSGIAANTGCSNIQSSTRTVSAISLSQNLSSSMALGEDIVVSFSGVDYSNYSILSQIFSKYLPLTGSTYGINPSTGYSWLYRLSDAATDSIVDYYSYYNGSTNNTKQQVAKITADGSYYILSSTGNFYVNGNVVATMSGVEAWVNAQGFATGTWVAANFPTTDYVNSTFTTMTAVQSWVNAQGFATQTWVAANFPTTAYVNATFTTPAWVNSQGFATETWVASNYAATAWVQQNYAAITWVAQNYASQTWVNSTFASQAWVGENYASQTWVAESFLSKTWAASGVVANSDNTITGIYVKTGNVLTLTLNLMPAGADTVTWPMPDGMAFSAAPIIGLTTSVTGTPHNVFPNYYKGTVTKTSVQLMLQYVATTNQLIKAGDCLVTLTVTGTLA